MPKDCAHEAKSLYLFKLQAADPSLVVVGLWTLKMHVSAVPVRIIHSNDERVAEIAPGYFALHFLDGAIMKNKP